MSDDLPPGITQADIDQTFAARGFYSITETLNHLAGICGSGKMKRDPERLLISAHHHIEVLRDRIKDREEALSLLLEWIDNWDPSFTDDDEWKKQDGPKIRAVMGQGDSINMCPICGEGVLQPRVLKNAVDYKGQSAELDLNLSVCGTCGSEQADYIQLRANKRAAAKELTDIMMEQGDE